MHLPNKIGGESSTPLHRVGEVTAIAARRELQSSPWPATAVFGGLCFTAASASGIFTMAFVL